MTDNENLILIPGRLHSVATEGHVSGADEIYDDVQQKNQETINSELIGAVGTGGSVDLRITNAVNAEKERAQGEESTLATNLSNETTRATDAEDALGDRVDTLEEAVGTGGSVDSRIASAVATETSRAQEAEANRYTKNETYTKEEVNNLITTPNQEYVSVTATEQTTVVTDVLPATGAANTIYRVGNWDGTQYNDSVFSEYAWDGSAYIKLSTKSQVGEVYDISANHADTKYADLAAALGKNGDNIPQSLRKGGMSIKFIQSFDNKYVQFRLMSEEFTTDTTQWAIADEGVYVDNPEYVYVKTDAEGKILWAIKADGSIYYGAGVPQQVKDYIDKKINKILGTDDITTNINSLKEIEAFLKDFTNSDTLKKLLDLKPNVDEVRAITNDIYKKSNPNDSEGNVVDTNTIFSIKDNPEYIKALTDSVGKLIEAIGIDGIRRFFAGINIQGTLQCVTDNPEYIAIWLDNQERIVFGFKTNGDPYFGYGIPSQINSVIESLKSNTKTRIDALQQSIDNNILALDYNSDTGELYSLTGEMSTINASIDDNGDVYLEQEII